MTTIVNMWASPRNISTAMMYAWAQRDDTTVWDEPMYGNYLVVSGVDHPMRDEIVEAMPTDAHEIVETMTRGRWGTPIVFYKNMAHHLVGIDIGIVDAMDNFLLTRDPSEMLPSLARGLGRTPTMADSGYDLQVQIVERIIASGRRPVVVDSRNVLDDPEHVLRELCDALGVPFDPVMLSWPAGPKPYDGVWGEHWYTRLHATTGFEPTPARPTTVSDDLVALRDRCVPLYERLLEFSIV